MLANVVRYSTYAGLLLVVGGVAMSIGFDQRDLGTVSGAIGIGILLLVAVPCGVIVVVKTGLRSIVRKSDKQPNKSPIESTSGSAPNEGSKSNSMESASPTADTHKTISHSFSADSWIASDHSLSYVDRKRCVVESNVSALLDAWKEKRSHRLFNKNVSIHWNKSDEFAAAWVALGSSFEFLQSDHMNAITGRRRNDLGAQKRSGGANVSISTERFFVNRNLPKGIRSSEEPYTILIGELHISIFPTIVVLGDNSSAAIFRLTDIKLAWDKTTMVGNKPLDAEVTGTTWKYVNVSGKNKGEPDLRRKDNYKIYEYVVDVLRIAIPQVEAELELHFSKTGCVKPFCERFRSVQELLQSDPKSSARA
jgi:hypothetical protein